MDVNTLLTSAAVAGTVSALGAALNQSRQHRREREEALRTRMIEAADDLAVVAVKAANLLVESAPNLRPVHEAEDLAARAHNDRVCGNIHQALTASKPLLDDALAMRQRIALLFGPHSMSTGESLKMVHALAQLRAACEQVATQWALFDDFDAGFNPVAHAVTDETFEFREARQRFIDAAHYAMQKPLAPQKHPLYAAKSAD